MVVGLSPAQNVVWNDQAMHIQVVAQRDGSHQAPEQRGWIAAGQSAACLLEQVCQVLENWLEIVKIVSSRAELKQKGTYNDLNKYSLFNLMDGQRSILRSPGCKSDHGNGKDRSDDMTK